MRSFTLTLFLLISPLFAGSVDRTKAPEPGPAPKIEIGAYQSFTLDNGLKVFVVENHKLPVLSVSLQLDFDPILEKDRVGFVEATGELLMRGTQSRTKAQLDEEIDFLGARINTSSHGLFAHSLSKHGDKLFELVSDVLLHPAFPDEELAKIKKEMLAGLKSMQDNPDAILRRVSNKVLFGSNHPYGELMTEKTLDTFTMADCKTFYDNFFRPNVGYLSIVGDISLNDAKELVTKYLGSWTKKDIPKLNYGQPKVPEKTTVIVVNKEGAVQTALALGSVADYKLSDADYMAGKLMNAILGGGGGRRLYNNLREEKGLTYGAYSRLSSDKLKGSFSASAKVRNEVTVEAVKAFQFEFNRIRNEQVPEDEFNQVKANVAGSFVRSLEKPETISRFAIDTAVYQLPQDFYENYLQNLQNVTQEQIQAAAQKFVPDHSGYIFAIGNANELAKALAEFGEVKVLDVNGAPVETVPEIPEGMTASKVIEGYLKAIGGKENLEKVHALATSGTFETMGMPLPYRDCKVAPDKFFMEISMNNQPVMKQVLNGDKGYMMQMGQRKDFTPEELKKAKQKNHIFPELEWLGSTTKLDLTGMENLGDKLAYKIQLTEEDGNTRTLYYDAQTFLKIKVLSTEDGPQGPIPSTLEIKDYMELDNLRIPSVIQIKVGPQNLQLTCKKAEINPKLEESLFSVE